MIGEGMSPQEATEKVGMVVEGMFTTEAAYELARARRRGNADYRSDLSCYQRGDQGGRCSWTC